MDSPLYPLGPDDPFEFYCGPQNTCFNTCCRDLNQFLTPYDILRLKTGLGLRSDQFLAQYTRCHTGPQTGFPIVTLQTDPLTGWQCPFVSKDGCRVYAYRPASCRVYPLVRIASRRPDTGRSTERYFLMKEPHCRGFSGDRRWTVRQWVADQELGSYNAFNDRLMEIIGLKNRRFPGPMAPESAETFTRVLYDLDRFRQQVFAEGLLDGEAVDGPLLSAAETDDLALLELGHRWACRTLFGVEMPDTTDWGG